MVVNYCKVISKSFQQEKDGGFSNNYRVEHIGKECVIGCFSGQERIIRRVQLIGT